jgi:hypothetical protein
MTSLSQRLDTTGDRWDRNTNLCSQSRRGEPAGLNQIQNGLQTLFDFE